MGIGKLVDGLRYIKLDHLRLDDGEGSFLGQGAHGAVVRGTLMDGGKVLDVAVKKVDTTDPAAKRSIVTELKVLSSLEHINIVHLLGANNESPNIMLVILQFCPLGDLCDVLLLFTGRDDDPAVVDRAVAVLAASGGNPLRVAGADAVAEARRRLSDKLGGALGAGANAAFFRVATGTAAAVQYIHSQVRPHTHTRRRPCLLVTGSARGGAVLSLMRLPTLSPPYSRSASCTATSSPRTCCSIPGAIRAFPTLASRSLSGRRGRSLLTVLAAAARPG